MSAVVPPFPHKPSRRARGLYIGNTLYVQTFLKTRKLHIQGTLKNRAAGSSVRCHPGTKQSVVRTSSMLTAVKMSNVIIFRDIQGSLFATQLSYIQMKLLPAYLNNSIIWELIHMYELVIVGSCLRQRNVATCFCEVSCNKVFLKRTQFQINKVLPVLKYLLFSLIASLFCFVVIITSYKKPFQIIYFALIINLIEICGLVLEGTRYYGTLLSVGNTVQNY